MKNHNETNQYHEILVGEGKNVRKIALIHRPARHGKREHKGSTGYKGIVWLGGFRSDMEGSKAIALDAYAEKSGLACTRHDYSGHGRSGGEFIDGSISRWLEESLAVFRAFTDGSQILVGSSMGGWISLRMVEELKKSGETDRIKGLVLLAPAPDFTKELFEPKLTSVERKALERDGYFKIPTPYSSTPNIFTKELFDDGEKNLVLDRVLDLGVPVHIIQGMEDPDVPWQHAMRLIEHLPKEDVTLTLVKDGDHRLSRDSDIARMLQIVDGLKDER